MRIAMTCPPWLAQAYVKLVDPERRSRRQCFGLHRQDHPRRFGVGKSMGPIQDRTKENLVSTDNAIIMARHRLRRAALALQHGTSPPGLRQECQRVRSATFVLPLDVPFTEAKRADLTVRQGIPHTSI
jgi:hypothetical protein